MATQTIKRSTTRMLHIPFSLLRDKEIDSDTLTILRRKHHLPSHLENVLRGKRFHTPADILRSAEIRQAASPLELLKLLVAPKYDQIPIPGQIPIPYKPDDGLLSVRALRPEGTELVVELWTLTASKYRLVLSYPESELVSITIDGNGEVDPATIRLGGFWWWEWPKLARETRELTYRRLVNDRAQAELLNLARMSPDAQPRFDSLVLPFRKVAQLVLFFQSATGTDGRATTGLVAGAPGSPTVQAGEIYDPNGMDLEDYPTSDPCSYSPDWPFERCCVAHDYCYLESENARGCDECARLQCDLDFLNCMQKIAGPNPALQEMAYIYFMAVRAFGDVGDNTFQYCSSSRGDGGVNLNKLLIVGALGVGVAVGVTIAASLGGVGGGVLGTLFGVGTAAGLVLVIGILMCEMCAELEEWIEECEADRIKREERCEKRRRSCKKKKKWWKKLGCYLAYFWHCIVVDLVLRGACWLVKKARPVLC
ncbi:MAG: hypothetical protein ACREJ6_14970 [Candidatus Methylomirabilis sp.]